MLADNALLSGSVLIILLLVQLLMRVPIAFALMTSSAVGLIMLDGFDIAMLTMGRSAFTQVSVYTLVVIPMFVAMGMFARDSGLGERIFSFLSRRLSKVPARLPVATVLACAAFGAVTGSSVATAASIGQMAIGEMLRHGVPARVATGVVASAGTLGVLIPPSIVLVLYGMATNEPIGALLIAGIIPGLLSALAMIVYLMGSDLLRRRKNAGVLQEVVAGGGDTPKPTVPAAPVQLTTSTIPTADKVSGWADAGTMLRIVLLFGIVIGGIYLGIMTPTESAAVGAITALVMLLIDKRRAGGKKLAGMVNKSIGDTASLTVMIFALLIGSTFLSAFITRAGITQSLVTWVNDIAAPAWVVVALMLLAMVPLGMFLEGMSMLLITAPLLYPIVISLGFDGIWFGILMVKIIELGLITPPVGMNAYVVAGINKGTSVATVFRGTIPFWLVDMTLIAIIFAFPPIATWLPSLMRG